MIRILNLIFLNLVLLVQLTHAQQETQYSQFMLNKYEMNPAYAGMDRSLSITGVNRNQWSGFVGQPNTTHINAHMPFYRWNGAFGLSISTESLGSLSNNSIKGSFNFVNETAYGLLSFGGSLGLRQIRLNGNELRTPDGIYEGPTINHNDPTISAGAGSGISPTWTLGAYFLNRDFEVGVSISDLPSNKIVTGDFKQENRNQLNLYLEYRYAVLDNFDIFPALFVKTDLTEWQSDFVALASYKRQYIGGLGLRGYSANKFDAIVVIAGLQINEHYRLTYSYDLGISSLSNHHSGTHEFVLNYNLQKVVGRALPTRIIYSPRFL